MLVQFSFDEETKDVISANNNNEMTYNGNTLKMLKQKRKRLESHKKDKEKVDDLLYYLISKPLKINRNKELKCTINKKELIKFFFDAKEKRCQKEIYNTPLYQLLCPYYLSVKKKYIDLKYIPQEIKEEFTDEKENLFERENNMNYNKYYDRKNKAHLELSTTNKSNYDIIQQAVSHHRILTRLKNEEDNFRSNLLLMPTTTVSELKTMITFLYRSILFEDKVEQLNLYYYPENFPNEKPLNNDYQTLLDLSKEMKSDFELQIYIHAYY